MHTATQQPQLILFKLACRFFIKPMLNAKFAHCWRHTEALTVQKEGNCHGSLMPTVSSERRVKLPLPGNPVEVVRCAACLALMVLSIWRSVNLAGTCRGLWTLNTKCKKERKVNKACHWKEWNLQFALLPTRSFISLPLNSSCTHWEWLASEDALLINSKGTFGKLHIFIHRQSQVLGTTSCLPLTLTSAEFCHRWKHL